MNFEAAAPARSEIKLIIFIYAAAGKAVSVNIQ
jgi:hypothetical protein